ncbi:HNH endonuclease [Hyphomicrobium sp. B1]|uniref:HNH endonuclease n=1 Tax=unclassified Hyphomicrobium TaxID=2619925 RepID=UPI00391DE1C8
MGKLRQEDPVRRAKLFLEQDGRCFYCTVPMLPPPFTRPRRRREVTLEHLIPHCEGGRRGFFNEVAACNACNGERGTMPWLLFFCLKEIERDGTAEARHAA